MVVYPFLKKKLLKYTIYSANSVLTILESFITITVLILIFYLEDYFLFINFLIKIITLIHRSFLNVITGLLLSLLLLPILKPSLCSTISLAASAYATTRKPYLLDREDREIMLQ